jgi:hypothetical protein
MRPKPQRLSKGDLASILAANPNPDAPPARRAPEDLSLTQGTAGWLTLGSTTTTADSRSHRTPIRATAFEQIRGSDDKHRQGRAAGGGMPAAPPLPDDLEQLLRRLRMPHTRTAAPEVLATARSQRWEPVEVLRALFTAEVAGRDRSALATRRARAAFPTGKTFHAWKPDASSIPAHPASAADVGMAAPQREPRPLRTSGTGKTFLLEALGQLGITHLATQVGIFSKQVWGGSD